MKRRAFLIRIVATGTTAASAAALLQACGGGGDSSSGAGGTVAQGGGGGQGVTQGGTDLESGCTTTIGLPTEGHEMLVTAEDLQAGEDKTYNIQGSASHNHTVTLTAADFNTLQAGGTVTRTSSQFGSHTHDVTVECV